MIRQRNNIDETGRIAVLHQAGRNWHVLVVELDGRRPDVLATRDFSAETIRTISDWLDEQQVTQILCVLPASTYICRTCTLPDVPPDAIEQALDLQVEAHLPDVVPGYRIGAAALDGAPGEANRSGMLIAWPESSRFQCPIDDERVRYVPDVAALAALMNGDRPADPLMAVDPNEGSIAIALTHANGAAFRAAKDSGDSASTWGESVGRVLAETALSVNHSGQFIEAIVEMARSAVRQAGDGQPVLMLPTETRDAARRRVHGASLEESWWTKYGIALGAALARAGELNGVTQLEHSPPQVSPSKIDALATSLARPRTAVWCAIACLLLLAFGPLALHATRVAVLKLRHGDLNARMADYENLMARHEMYDDLKREGWPMTKLISDLTTNTPPGIELDSFYFSDGSFIASGRSIPFDYPAGPDGEKWSENYPVGRQDGLGNIAIMQKNLAASSIFNNVTFNTREPNAFQHYEFSVQADIAQPYYDRNYSVDWDFARWTMQQRVDAVGPGEEKYPADSADASTDGSFASSDITGDRETSTDRESSGFDQTSTASAIGDEEASMIGSGDASATSLAGRTPGGRSIRDTRPPRTPPSGSAGNTGGDGAGNFSNPGERTGGVSGPAFEIPEMLTREQIAAMDRAEILAILTKVAEAKTAVRGKDEELFNKLDDQWKMLFARLNEIGPEQ